MYCNGVVLVLLEYYCCIPCSISTSVRIGTGAGNVFIGTTSTDRYWKQLTRIDCAIGIEILVVDRYCNRYWSWYCCTGKCSTCNVVVLVLLD